MYPSPVGKLGGTWKLAMNEPAQWLASNVYVRGKKSESSRMRDASQRLAREPSILNLSATRNIKFGARTYEAETSERPASNSMIFDRHIGNPGMALPMAERKLKVAMNFIS